VVDVLAVLAEPNRRRLLELLRAGERSVSELAQHFAVTRSAISQHLGVLASAGLVSVRREGRNRYYRLDPTGMAALRHSIDNFWTDELAELATAQPKKGAKAMAFEKSVFVPLDPDETFALITEPERLRRWQAVTARIDLRAGGDYRWTIVPGHTASGTVTEVEPGRRVVLSWGWEDNTSLPPGSSTVTVTLEPAEGGTQVHLVHDGLSEEEANGHGEGWTHYLERLVEAASAGDAGPDSWAHAPEDLDELKAAEASLAWAQRALRLPLAEGLDKAPTPCSDFTLHDLVEHLFGSITSLGGAAGAEIEPVRGSGPEVLIAGAGAKALEAWRGRGLAGMVDTPFEMPAKVAAGILTMELFVHGWDAAMATGRPYEPSDELAEFVLGVAHSVVNPDIRKTVGFADEIEVAEDAPPLSRLLAFTGRTTPTP
jgi:uncharacterized protein (TIGR03086 family)